AFDPVTQQVQAVTGLEFDGGRIALTDISFVLNYFPLGTVAASGTGMAATVDTPAPPGPVTGDSFPTDPHEVIFNEGSIHAYGTGLLTGVVDIDFDLAQDPATVTSQTDGTIQLTLLSQTATTAAYTAHLILPANFEMVLLDDPENQILIEMYTVGTIRATGQYTRCLLEADLTGDCRVDLADLDVLAGQWLAAGEPADCPLTADLSGDDCLVDLRDFAVLAGQWLAGVP
ncbi:MAG: hypothetical protein JW810_03665, partial [Sedimentisphaerales bacterium]|nr:hypothetical protein [Sedimentisphaerales bacterium]